jgi:glycosyltransferase involved in cell wall biosynthesis
MRIGADVRPFLEKETGVGVYFRNLLFRLAARDRENEYYLFSSSWKTRFRPERIPPFARGRFRDFRIPVRAVNWLWRNWSRPSLDALFGVRLDLAHSPTPLVLPTRGRKIVTVYDLFFLDEPERADREARRIFQRRVGASLKQADGVLTISEFTRRALLDRFPLDERRVRTTHLGVDDAFRGEPDPADLERVRAELNLPRRFLLFVGASEPRKNLAGLVEALGLVRAGGLDVGLVVAGRPGDDEARVREAVARNGLESHVRFAGYLSDPDVRILYRLAAALVLPSFSEGFGLPVVEAMASGTPVVCSAAGALPEVAGSAAHYFDPRDPRDIAAQAAAVLDDAAMRGRLIAEGLRRSRDFDWGRTAADTLAFYEEVAGRS